MATWVEEREMERLGQGSRSPLHMKAVRLGSKNTKREGKTDYRRLASFCTNEGQGGPSVVLAITSPLIDNYSLIVNFPTHKSTFYC
jgi:hypothetical protein